MTINYTKNYQGALILSAMVNGYLVEKTYYGYTKTEATRHFREAVTA